MTFQEFLNTVGLTTTSFWGIVVFLGSIGIEVIPKIKWSPWSALFKWIGDKFNNKLDEKMDAIRGEVKAIEKKVDYVQTELSKHINESEDKALQDTRRDILDFCNACMNKRKHTREQFVFVLKQCDAYEAYIEKNHVKNGEISAAIREIRRLYDKCIQENSFLKEGEEKHD